MKSTKLKDSIGKTYAQLDYDGDGNCKISQNNVILGHYIIDENKTYKYNNYIERELVFFGEGNCLVELLGYGRFYVYVLINPLENNKPFYVGKGYTDRALHHFNEAGYNTQSILSDIESDENKCATINKIQSNGFKPEDIVRVICRRVSEEVALAIEACLIKNVYGLKNLTNLIEGQNSHHFRSNDLNQHISNFDFDTDINGNFVQPTAPNKLGDYYVYILKNPETNEVFYVGKGSSDRLSQHFYKLNKSNPKNKKEVQLVDLLSKYKPSDIGKVLAIVDKEHVAYMLESLYIKFIYGYDKLDNIQPGHYAGLFRAKGDWLMRKGFDIPILVEFGQRRDELLDIFLGCGAENAIVTVMNELEKISQSEFNIKLNFSSPKVFGSGELGIESKIYDNITLHIHARCSLTIQCALVCNNINEKNWLIEHFKKIGIRPHRKDYKFSPLAWRGSKNLTTDINEALRRAKFLIKLASISSINYLTPEEKEELNANIAL